MNVILDKNRMPFCRGRCPQRPDPYTKCPDFVQVGTFAGRTVCVPYRMLCFLFVHASTVSLEKGLLFEPAFSALIIFLGLSD